MRDVSVRHDPVVGTDPGHASALGRSDVQRAELPDRVALADPQLGRLAGVLLVLRNLAQRAERIDPVVAADARMAGNHHMRFDRGAGLDRNIRPDHAERAHLDFVGQFRARIDNRAGVDARH